MLNEYFQNAQIALMVSQSGEISPNLVTLLIRLSGPIKNILLSHSHLLVIYGMFPIYVEITVKILPL